MKSSKKTSKNTNVKRNSKSSKKNNNNNDKKKNTIEDNKPTPYLNKRGIFNKHVGGNLL